MKRTNSYTWPFDIDGHCWRVERLFYLYLNGLGFIFLFSDSGPKLVAAIDIDSPTIQTVFDFQTMDPRLRRNIWRAVRAVYRECLATPGFSKLPRPAVVPDHFPRLGLPRNERQRITRNYLDNQSTRLH